MDEEQEQQVYHRRAQKSGIQKAKDITRKTKKTVKTIKTIIKILSNPLTWKILAIVIAVVILVAGFYKIIDNDKEDGVNDKVSTTIETQYALSSSPGSTSISDSDTNKIGVQQNTDKTGFEITYNNDPEYLEGVKEQLENGIVDSAADFTAAELAVIGALLGNGADLQYYSEEELKCFPTFVKAEAATQNLDLRPNSEKIIGGVYVPQKIEDLADNEIPGVILVQRTNTSEDTSKILEYKDAEAFEALLLENPVNPDILNYFTIGENGNIIIAKWEHVKTRIIEGEYPENLDETEKEVETSEEGQYLITTEEIEYGQYISKYKMPFEFLIQLLVITTEPDFCMELVDHVLNSKIVIDIQEQQTVTVTDETRNYLVHSKDKKYLNYEITAVQKHITTEENIGKEEAFLNYAQDDEGNNCTNYYEPPKNITVKIRTEYKSHTYSFGIVEADTWMAHYTKTYAPQGAKTEPSVTTNIENKGEYKQIGAENSTPITDTQVINADKDVIKFISQVKANYEPKIIVPLKVTISDAMTDEYGNNFKTLYITYSNGRTEEYSKYEEYKDENGNGTGEYGLPSGFFITTDKVDATETTKEIPKITYIFELNSSSDGYELKTNINPLVECNVSALSIESYEKLELLNTSTRTVTVTKHPADPNPITNTHIYAVDENGNFEKFLEVYDKSKGAQNQLNSIDSWLYEMMEKREETVELVDVIKYLLYMYDGYDRGVTKLEGIEDTFKPSDMKNANKTDSFNQYVRYLHAFEGGGILPTYKNSNGEECYKVEPDGSENGLAVGYGVDIGVHGGKLSSLGYDISEGALIPVEVVDAIEKEERSKWLDYVKTETAELELTEYQIYALASRSYNCGYDSTTSAYSTVDLNFVESFKKYWNKETDDKYGQDASVTDFNHELYTTFMAWPVKADGKYTPGLENRRKSEWCLFQTGYYGYDIKYGAGNGIDEYCSSGSSDFTNNINLYNEDGSVNLDSIKQLEDWITNDLLNTKIHKGDYAMQNGPFEKWWDSANNEFTDGNKFQCTWYVYGRANQYLELNGTKYTKWLGSRGNAQTWYYKKDNGGEKYFECGKEPRQNSIVVWKSGSYGHVAYVEAVDLVNNKVYISHAGSGRSWLGITEHTIEEIKTLWGYELLGYVYLDSPK